MFSLEIVNLPKRRRNGLAFTQWSNERRPIRQAVRNLGVGIVRAYFTAVSLIERKPSPQFNASLKSLRTNAKARAKLRVNRSAVLGRPSAFCCTQS